MADDLRKRLKEQEVDFLLTDKAKMFLAKEGFDPTYGARPFAERFRSILKIAYRKNC